MKVKSFKVGYKELRSANFDNKCYEIAYEVELEPEDDLTTVRRKYLERAIKEVKMLHGDICEGDKVELVVRKDIPF